MTILKKSISAGLVALTLGLGLFGSSAPAAAWGRGGYYGGGWGYHGGWHGGWGGGWHRGGWGGPVAAGVIGGLALGAIAASSYHPAYYYGGCHWERRPVVDNFGYVVGSEPVRICR